MLHISFISLYWHFHTTYLSTNVKVLANFNFQMINLYSDFFLWIHWYYDWNILLSWIENPQRDQSERTGPTLEGLL
jgi:hypothetical protein